MALATWNPFRDMEELFGRYGRGLSPSLREGEWLPAVDISETDKAYLIKAELPGIDKNDVHLTVQNNVLTIEGERKSEEDEKDEKHHRVERYYGRFVRSFGLPEDADQDKIKAENKNGVLRVRIPKAKAETPKKIDVEVQ